MTEGRIEEVATAVVVTDRERDVSVAGGVAVGITDGSVVAVTGSDVDIIEVGGGWIDVTLPSGW